MLHGGGAFLLTLSVIAGVCLITIPAKSETIDSNVHAATTYVRDGIEYETVYLTDDTIANKKLINSHKTGNTRYVLTQDWNTHINNYRKGEDTSNLIFWGDYLIFDLNGHTFYPCSGGDGDGMEAAQICTFVSHFEIMDSSAAQTGAFAGNGLSFVVYRDVTVTISGGTNLSCGAITTTDKRCNLIVRGGNWGVANSKVLFSGNFNSITVAPWVDAHYDNGHLAWFTSPLYFAVSAYNVVSGIYNYAFGYAQELTVDALADLVIPADQTYYLWGRYLDGGYAYLNIVYDNNLKSWIIADSKNLVA